MALQMSKEYQRATISDLRDVNRILKKVREKESQIKYEYLGDADDLIIVGIGGKSFK